MQIVKSIRKTLNDVKGMNASTAGRFVMQNQMVGEFKSEIINNKPPLAVTENRRVSFFDGVFTRPKFMTSACTCDNFVSNAMCSNETIAYLRTVGSSGSPLNLTSSNIKYDHEEPKVSGRNTWQSNNYYQPNLRPEVSQARPPPGFPPFILYSRLVSYDELFLPRPEFKKFNGNPLEFKSFIADFETHIEPRVIDNQMLFSLLLQHCEDKIKPKIEHYAERGALAYGLAKERLHREYGKECLIADMCEQRLFNVPSVKSNDPEGLKNYSEILEKALITLQTLSSFASVNSLDSMMKLIYKLPFE